jgi:hypothetical protein
MLQMAPEAVSSRKIARRSGTIANRISAGEIAGHLALFPLPASRIRPVPGQADVPLPQIPHNNAGVKAFTAAEISTIRTRLIDIPKAEL